MLNNTASIKDREALYRLIISQLFYDGHQTLAVSLSNMVKAHPACPPSDRLLNIVSAGLRVEQGVHVFNNWEGLFDEAKHCKPVLESVVHGGKRVHSMQAAMAAPECLVTLPNQEFKRSYAGAGSFTVGG